VTLTTRKYFYTSFSLGTWLTNLHVQTRHKFVHSNLVFKKGCTEALTTKRFT